jgi:hypothetical protein
MKQSVEFKSDLYLSECVYKSNIIEHDIICMISENCSEIKDAIITICVFWPTSLFGLMKTIKEVDDYKIHN